MIRCSEYFLLRLGYNCGTANKNDIFMCVQSIYFLLKRRLGVIEELVDRLSVAG